MARSIVSLNTSDVPAAERASFWMKALGQVCGKLHADSYGARTLDGQIDYAEIGQLRLCRIRISRHRVVLPLTWARSDHHSVIKILFQTAGRLIFEQDGRRLEIAPGGCLAYDVSRPHVITSENVSEHDAVIIPKQVVRRRGMPFDIGYAQTLSAEKGAPLLAHELILSTFREIDNLSEDCELGVAEALLDLLSLPFSSGILPKFSKSRPEEVKWRAKVYIREHLGDPELSIERISAALSCTARYLHMSFAEENTSISEYIWCARLEKCRRELERSRVSGKSITEIAFTWGFSSSSHFSRLFKKQFGVSPSSFTKRVVARPVGPLNIRTKASGEVSDTPRQME